MNNVDENLRRHVCGQTQFVDDRDYSQLELTGYVVTSPYPHARIREIDRNGADALPGVYAVLSAADIPGANRADSINDDYPCLAEDECLYEGQAVLLIAAESLAVARRAAARIRIDYEELPAVTTLKEAIAQGKPYIDGMQLACGDVEAAMAHAAATLSGQLETGGQEHAYLETMSAIVVPEKEEDMHIYTSSQNPSEVQEVVAELLGVSVNKIQVEVGVLGGSFGGKESQGAWTASWAALLARATGRPVRLTLSCEEDMRMTGKRHPVLSTYRVAYEPATGIVTALDVEGAFDMGCSKDLSASIMDRYLLHIDNAYHIPHIRVRAVGYRTNRATNTAFRGFGAPQAMVVTELVMDRIAEATGLDPAEVRYRNYYRDNASQRTHYGQACDHLCLHPIHEQLLASSDYRARKEAVAQFNASHADCKRGLSFMAVKFGISFTCSFLNQGGALVHIYKDGSVWISHGGIEMGQGLNEKMRLVASRELGIAPRLIQIASAATDKVPNTSPTAASTGADLNGMAIKHAIDRIKEERLDPFAHQLMGIPETAPLRWADGCISDPESGQSIPFTELVIKAYLNQISLSANGFYATPGVHYNMEEKENHPFHYFVGGACVSEVEVDLLTGQHQLLRCDILHDCGNTLCEEIDLGQLQGAYIQGAGWVTTEELVYDARGRLLTVSPETYKVPGIRDIPPVFNTALFKGNALTHTIGRSKAVGEPPLVYGISAALAIRQAVLAARPELAAADWRCPATAEATLLFLASNK